MSPLVLFGISIVRGVTGSSFPPRFFPTVKFGFSLWILFPVQKKMGTLDMGLHVTASIEYQVEYLSLYAQSTT